MGPGISPPPHFLLTFIIYLHLNKEIAAKNDFKLKNVFQVPILGGEVIPGPTGLSVTAKLQYQAFYKAEIHRDTPREMQGRLFDLYLLFSLLQLVGGGGGGGKPKKIGCVANKKNN